MTSSSYGILGIQDDQWKGQKGKKKREKVKGKKKYLEKKVSKIHQRVAALDSDNRRRKKRVCF